MAMPVIIWPATMIVMVITMPVVKMAVRLPAVLTPFVVSLPPVMIAPVATVPVVTTVVTIADLQFHCRHKGDFCGLHRQRSHQHHGKR
jgi:hypothetical protein